MVCPSVSLISVLFLRESSTPLAQKVDIFLKTKLHILCWRKRFDFVPFGPDISKLVSVPDYLHYALKLSNDTENPQNRDHKRR